MAFFFLMVRAFSRFALHFKSYFETRGVTKKLLRQNTLFSLDIWTKNAHYIIFFIIL